MVNGLVHYVGTLLNLTWPLILGLVAPLRALELVSSVVNRAEELQKRCIVMVDLQKWLDQGGLSPMLHRDLGTSRTRGNPSSTECPLNKNRGVLRKWRTELQQSVQRLLRELTVATADVERVLEERNVEDTKDFFEWQRLSIAMGSAQEFAKHTSTCLVQLSDETLPYSTVSDLARCCVRAARRLAIGLKLIQPHRSLISGRIIFRLRRILEYQESNILLSGAEDLLFTSTWGDVKKHPLEHLFYKALLELRTDVGAAAGTLRRLADELGSSRPRNTPPAALQEAVVREAYPSPGVVRKLPSIEPRSPANKRVTETPTFLPNAEFESRLDSLYRARVQGSMDSLSTVRQRRKSSLVLHENPLVHMEFRRQFQADLRGVLGRPASQSDVVHS